MSNLSSAFLGLFLFFSSYTAEAQLRIVELTTLSDYEPFTFGADEATLGEQIEPGHDSKALKGYAWDVTREAFHAMGVAITLNVVPWKRAVKMLENGDTDILFPTTRTNQRLAKGYRFSEHSVLTINQTLYVRADDPVIWDGDVNSLYTILNGKKVGTRLGWSYGNWWDANKSELGARLDENTAGSTNFKKLQRNRLDFVLAYDAIADLMLFNAGQTVQFKKVGRIDQTSEYIAAFGENGSSIAIDLFDQGYAKIEANGKLDEIRRKWRQ